MHNEDTDWLLEKLPFIKMDEAEAFTEKTAYLLSNTNLSVYDCREIAFDMLQGGDLLV